jgi:two-component system chemotaxis sensor kinase CheA
MDKDQLVKRLMTTFLEEVDEHVRALNRGLLDLKRNSDGPERGEQVRKLFRTAHSLKGAARSVSVHVMEDACHHLEGILAGVQNGALPLGSDLFALLFRTTDAIEEAGHRLREEKDLAGSPLAGLVPRLLAATGQPGSPGSGVRGQGSGVSDQATRSSIRPAPEKTLPAAPTEPEARPSSAGPGTVRVAAEKLDAWMAQSGELTLVRQRIQTRAAELTTLREAVSRWRTEWQSVAKPLAKLLQNGNSRAGAGRLAGAVDRVGGRLRKVEKELERLAGAVASDSRHLDQAAGALDAEVRRVRMLPFAQACEGLERMVYDLAQAGGKEVDLVIEGGDIELDRSVLEGLKDCLRHLVRNAIDHGAETPAQRRAAGKAPRAKVTVAAVLRGAQVEVVVSDDGRGLDLDALRQQVRKKGLPEPADDRELAALIFLPALSTAPLITDVSGRGVGLDVVKSRVEGLHGTVDVTNTAGRGIRFALDVPLTLTTLRALLVTAGGRTFAFVGTNVQKLLRVEAAELRTIEGREMLALGGAPLPVVALSQTLSLPNGSSRPPGARLPALIVAAGNRRLVFVVDELVAEQEILVKNLGARIRHVPHVAGATLLPSGRIALVLNAANLLRTALSRSGPSGLRAALDPQRPTAKKRVLLVEDSLTTRALEKSILEAAGYEVATAADGEEAWRLLQEHGADLVVSDVEMPRLDGFALTEAVRGSKRFRDLPVVLVTARGNDADRSRGVQVGANAYLVKSAFDQRNLLETLAQLF